jgi:hypothetical protein
LVRDGSPPEERDRAHWLVSELGLKIHVDRLDLASMQPLVAEIEDILENGSLCEAEEPETRGIRARGAVAVSPPPSTYSAPPGSRNMWR